MFVCVLLCANVVVVVAFIFFHTHAVVCILLKCSWCLFGFKVALRLLQGIFPLLKGKNGMNSVSEGLKI